MSDKHDDTTSVPAPAVASPPPVPSSTFDVSHALGRIDSTLAMILRRLELGDAQFLNLLQQGNDLGHEMKKFAGDLVDVRAMLKSHMDDPHAHGHGSAPRPPAASITNEVKATHESIRAVAETSQKLAEGTLAVANETAKQTPMIQQSIDASLAASNVAVKTAKDQKWTAWAIALTALLGFLTQLLARK